MAKSCGSCSMCCKIPPIDDTFKKPAHVWCTHCKPGQGCSIYENRPKPCVEFRCLWLEVPDLGDELKPDRCRVIMQETRREDEIVMFCSPADYDTAWRKLEIMSFLQFMLSQGMSVLFTDHKRMSRFEAHAGRWSRFDMIQTDDPPQEKGQKFFTKGQLLQTGSL